MSSKKECFFNTVLFFCPQGLPEVYRQIIKSDNENYNFCEIESFKRTEDLAVKHRTASVLFCIRTQTELVQLLSFCKVNAEKIHQGVIKVGGLNFLGVGKLDDLLKKSGVSDLFLDSISPKTLDYKLSFWEKSIQTNLKKISTTNAFDLSDVDISGGKINVLPAINFSSDCWLLDTALDEPRKVLGHWIVDLLGPSPYAGRWVEIKNNEICDDRLWEWVPLRTDLFPFIEHDGRWVASGKQPLFSWKTNSWKFMGLEPALFFQCRNDEPFVRFIVEDENLNILEDSELALAQKKLISKSLDPKFLQKSSLNLKNLCGEGLTEEIDSTPLKGELTKSDFEKMSTNLRGTIQPLPEKRKEKNKSNFKSQVLDGFLSGRFKNLKEESGKDIAAELSHSVELTKLHVELMMKYKNAEREISVKLGDLIDNLLVLFVPIGFSKFDEVVNLKITCSYGIFSLDFTVAGVVVDYYENDDKTECCNIELKDYSDLKLKQFRRLFGDRQKNITDFFMQARGFL